LNPVTSAGRTSVDIGTSANLELVDKFCYFGDMLSVEGDADGAVEARIQVGWNKFRQLVPLLTNEDISLIRRGKLYSSSVQSSMLHGSETWTVRKENMMALQRAEMRMVRCSIYCDSMSASLFIHYKLCTAVLSKWLKEDHTKLYVRNTSQLVSCSTQ